MRRRHKYGTQVFDAQYSAYMQTQPSCPEPTCTHLYGGIANKSL